MRSRCALVPHAETSLPLMAARPLTATDPYDAGTSERKCDPIGWSDACTPGCTYGTARARWCNEERGWPCAWPPDHLSEQIEIRDRIAAADGDTWELDAPRDFVDEGAFYNELIMDYNTFHRNLPESIDAIFYIPGECDEIRPQWWMSGHQTPKCEEYARWAHSELLARWPERARNIPLLALNNFEWHAPFSLP